RPARRDLGALHLEDDRPIGVRDDAGATLPGDRVERIDAALGEAAIEGHTAAARALLRRRALLGGGSGRGRLRRSRSAGRLTRTSFARPLVCSAVQLIPYDRRLRHPMPPSTAASGLGPMRLPKPLTKPRRPARLEPRRSPPAHRARWAASFVSDFLGSPR